MIGIFETGAYGVPSKSQNPIVLDQDRPYFALGLAIREDAK